MQKTFSFFLRPVDSPPNVYIDIYIDIYIYINNEIMNVGPYHQNVFFYYYLSFSSSIL